MAVSVDWEHSMAETQGGWTLEAVLALPEDRTGGHRVELVDGALIVSAWPRIEHQRVLGRLQRQLQPVVPSVLELLPGVNLALGGDRLLVPDLVISRDPGCEGLCLTGEQMFLVCEVASPSTRLKDQTLKRALYAQARIPFHLLVDPAPDEVSATLFELTGEDYEPIARTEHGRLALTRPFEVTLELG